MNSVMKGLILYTASRKMTSTALRSRGRRVYLPIPGSVDFNALTNKCKTL